MSCCAHGAATDAHFGRKAALRDLERYHRRGPQITTRLILEAIESTSLRGGSLLDIGGGIGMLHHELLGNAIAHATHVDAASAYVRVAKEEDARRGAEGTVDYHVGDAVELSDELPEADLVALDRVICCYPDWESLVRASASKAPRLYAFSVPHDRWYVRIVVTAENLLRRLRGNDFRAFVHPVGAIDGLLRNLGLRRLEVRRTVAWHVALYSR